MAVASLVESEVPIKRLLLLVERARQGVAPDSYIPFHNWSSVIQNTMS